MSHLYSHFRLFLWGVIDNGVILEITRLNEEQTLWAF